MEIVTYIINSFLQCMVLGIYLKNMLGLKRRPVFLWITWLALEILNRGYTWVLEMLETGDDILPVFRMGYYMIVIFCMAYVNCSGNWKKKMLYCVLYGLVSTTVETLLLGILSSAGLTTSEVVATNTAIPLIANVMTQTILFAIIQLLWLTGAGKAMDENSGPKWWIVCVTPLLCSFAVALMGVSLMKKETISMEEIAVLIILVVIGFSCYFFSELQMEESRLETENLIYLNQIQMHQERYEELRRIRREIDAFQHDIKNHVGVLRRLCDVGEENSEEAVKDIREYLDSMESNYYGSEKMTDTGNIVIDSVIDMKKSYAASLGIRVDVVAFLPEDMDFDGRDAITLLANLFDNAIEACQKAGADKKIDLEIQYHKGDLLIYMENTCDGSTDGLGGCETDPLPETGKQGKQKHGHGMRNMLRTVEKYQGNFRWKGENGIFSVEIVLSGFAKEKMTSRL